jgi:type IX secretion system PorP/SprF family membrane protein
LRKLYQPLKLILIGLCFSLGAKAQDIHFSQFYASPLTLSPAMTGMTEGSYRAVGIYRNQWRSVTAPFHTYGASFDIKLLEGKLKKDVFAVGGQFVGDKSGDGDLSMLSILGSVAYHKRMGKNHFLGIGLQVGFNQRSLNYQQLAFPNQFTGVDFDPNSPNQEPITGSNIGYLDVNIGMLWQGFFSDRVSGFGGVSAFHIHEPSESFLGESTPLKRRYVGHAGMRIGLNDLLALTPNVLYMYQNKAQEINFGAAIEFNFMLGDKKSIASVGGWYRVGDALILSTSFDYNRLRFGFAYDFNLSDLNAASNGRGAFEIAIQYTGFITYKTPVTRPVLVPCPRL